MILMYSRVCHRLSFIVFLLKVRDKQLCSGASCQKSAVQLARIEGLEVMICVQDTRAGHLCLVRFSSRQAGASDLDVLDVTDGKGGARYGSALKLA